MLINSFNYKINIEDSTNHSEIKDFCFIANFIAVMGSVVRKSICYATKWKAKQFETQNLSYSYYCDYFTTITSDKIIKKKNSKSQL